eukprot:TRINITY_DN16622_c0_g1_i1.p1 TRINITY_DN16622_c0_g1~~TRINITY_DN16622_c0_g1_i1.p1  ORF type:complete len:215 (+),score=49.29 TRINITY_DN16622_c0_g1_i1:275-919(+)
MTEKAAKIVIIGDGAVGKTSLLWRWAKREFKPEHEPTVFENYSTAVPVSGVNGKPARQQKLTLWDTGGQETFDKLRQLSYPHTHIFIICFSLDDRISYENVSNVWHAEILPHLSGSPPANAQVGESLAPQPARIILVGTKVDLREAAAASGADTSNFIGTEEGDKLAADINADAFIECSAKTEKNVKKVFDEAVRAFLKPPPSPAKKKGPCVIL